MRYTPIPPINYIERVTMKTKSIFMLAQLWKLNQYRQAIKNLQLDLIVLDNGAYEREIVSDDYLTHVIQQVASLHPNAKIHPIAPDEIQNPKLTIKRVKQFFEYLDENQIRFTNNVSLLGVIQVDPEADKQTAINQAIEFSYQLLETTSEFENRLCGFAIPIWFYRKWNYRGEFGQALRNTFGNSLYLHALGLDDLDELLSLKPYFNSVDSSLPFTLAYYNKTFEHVKKLDSETKKRLNIARVPLKSEVPENSLYLDNLDVILKVIH